MRPSAGRSSATQSRVVRKEPWASGRDEFDGKAILTGALLAVVVWPLLILILWLISLHLGKEPTGIMIDPSLVNAQKNFEINIVEPEEFLMPEKPKQRPPQFVEVNPDAPENIPDDTANFGARNQQAAQEKPNPDAHGDRAATEGKKDFQSNQIVSGALTPPTDTTPAPAPTPEVAQALKQAQAEAKKAQDPLAGFEKRIGDNPEGFGMNEAQASDNATAETDKKVEGMRDAPLTVGESSPKIARIDPRKPMPRQHIEKQRVRPAIFAENKIGTSNLGIAGIDSRWSNYGAYLQRLVDTVQIQFDNLVEHSGVFPPTGTIVTIHFRIDKTGAITEIIDSKSTGGSQAEAICKSAITSRGSYGAWTDDMVAMLGDSQEMTFCFYYGTP